MTAGECKERADKCLAAAQSASDGEAQRHWHQLADMWLSWAEKLAKFRVINQKLEAPKSTAERMASKKGEAAEMADQLRSWLALNETYDGGNTTDTPVNKL
jgi:hypothetical protein